MGSVPETVEWNIAESQSAIPLASTPLESRLEIVDNPAGGAWLALLCRPD